MKVQNRLAADSPLRLALETAITEALAGLEGPWDVVIESQAARTLVVAVVCPDGSSWSLTCDGPRERDPERIAEAVRAACARRSVLRGRRR